MFINASMKRRFKTYFKRGKKAECWLWIGSLDTKGYGRLASVNKLPILAHRLSYHLHHGGIPKGLHILHACDTPACVNPHHLEAGTHLNNMQDAQVKGRMQRGEKRWNAKLTPAKVRAIRKDASPYNAIARKHGVDASLISYVKRGKIWKHVL